MYYNELQQAIKTADKMIAKLAYKTAPGQLNAISLDSVHAGNVTNTYEQIYQLQLWTERKSDTLEEIKKIDDTLNAINRQSGCEYYKDILTLWYVDKIPKREIARKLGFADTSRGYMFVLKNRAIKKFAVALFGIDALEML